MLGIIFFPFRQRSVRRISCTYGLTGHGTAGRNGLQFYS